MSSYLLGMVVGTMFVTQGSPAPPKARTTEVSPTITLTGCVSQDATTPGSYTFSDAKTGVKYRLSGVNVSKDEGKRGEVVVGTGARRVTIRGGLVPSPNVAAQAGALDRQSRRRRSARWTE